MQSLRSPAWAVERGTRRRIDPCWSESRYLFHLGADSAATAHRFIADTHLGSVLRPPDIDRALALLLAATPDLLLFGGDYVSESPRHIPDAAAVLGNVANATRFGSLAVLGNHDYANGAARMTAALEKRGIRVLRNESARVGDDTGELWISGIDDALLGSPDPQRAFASVPSNARAIALWHEPDWAEQVVRWGLPAALRPQSRRSGAAAACWHGCCACGRQAIREGLNFARECRSTRRAGWRLSSTGALPMSSGGHARDIGLVRFELRLAMMLGGCHARVRAG